MSEIGNTIYGTDGDDVLNGGAGDDNLYGGLGNDGLFGAAGADRLSGDGGNDRLSGGLGNDYLIGGTGSDSMVFARGDGQDVIGSTYDAAVDKVDTLIFLEGIAPADLLLGNSGSSLTIRIAGTTDQLTVQNFLYQDNLSTAHSPLQRVLFADGTIWDANTILAKLLAGTDGNDLISGTSGADTITGQDGTDNLYGRAGNDSIAGGAGADYLNGDAGNDQLDGGLGNDYLQGGLGNDSYLFGRGDGQDSVASMPDATAGKIDSLVFKEGIAPADIVVTGSGTTLVLKIAGSTDQISFMNFLYQDRTANTSNPLQQVVFADGTVWNTATILEKLFAGTAGNDSYSGTSEDDVMSGLGGNDSLSGRAGNDTIDGGAGTDYLFGDDGNDTLIGGADLDVLNGGAGDDILDGGTGNDYLNGGLGSDTFLIAKGDGYDTISRMLDATAGKVDTLKFQDVASTEAIFGITSGQLVIRYAGSTDQVNVDGFLYQDTLANNVSPVQQIVFSDGIVMSGADILAKVFAGTQGNDNVSGTSAADTITGLGGNDTVYGRGGNDTLDGGAGNDYLFGDDGDDTVRGGAESDLLSGGAGNDVLEGGLGHDSLNGGIGSDTYLYARGDGVDSISAGVDATVGKIDTLQFKDIVAGDVAFSTSPSYLTIRVLGANDQINIHGFLYQDVAGTSYSGVQQIEFADGLIMSAADILAKVFAGTEGSDSVSGTLAADTITGLGGNDYLSGRGGNDTVDGGAGADMLNGDDGDDVLKGGADNDYLFGGNGSDILDGGAGNDTLVGGLGNDTFLFGKGDGADTIMSSGEPIGTRFDTLQFKDGVLPVDVRLTMSGTSLIVKVSSGADYVTVNSFMYQNSTANGNNPLQQIKFADGTAWSLADIEARIETQTNDPTPIEPLVIVTGRIDPPSITIDPPAGMF